MFAQLADPKRLASHLPARSTGVAGCSIHIPTPFNDFQYFSPIRNRSFRSFKSFRSFRSFTSGLPQIAMCRAYDRVRRPTEWPCPSVSDCMSVSTAIEALAEVHSVRRALDFLRWLRLSSFLYLSASFCIFLLSSHFHFPISPFPFHLFSPFLSFILSFIVFSLLLSSLFFYPCVPILGPVV